MVDVIPDSTVVMLYGGGCTVYRVMFKRFLMENPSSQTKYLASFPQMTHHPFLQVKW
jgi:hypothetical protein